ncbi:MAG TPA: hypothetical protein VKX49_26025 [Bryobacteraceae bacterium]|nr:hypothetical protein [Bryobacteraceae bacterium]
MRKTLAVLFTVAASIANAASSYHVNLYKPTTVNGTELKPGDCKLELQADKVILKQGKTTVETKVTVQNAEQKFALTTVGYEDSSNNQLRDLRLGGTTLKLLFDNAAKPDGAVAGR